MDKSKSYAEVTTPNKYKDSVNDWPDLKNQQKNQVKPKLTGKSSDQLYPGLNTLTNAMERLSTNKVSPRNGQTETQKSKDEIRAERQLRRKNEKHKKAEQRFQEKLAQIREPKSQKVQVVDKAVMETYLKTRKVSPVRDGRQRKFKNHSGVKIDLLDLINAKVVKPIDRSSIQNKQKIKLASGRTQCHKGKKSVVQKKKYVSKLKRSILLSRLQRNHMRTMLERVPNDVDSDLKKSESNNEEKETSNENSKIVTELPSTIEPSGVKFSRKFRPYCDNLTSSELLSLTEALLRDIFRFQDRAYNKNEIKARSQRRYVVGFKESMRQLDIKK